MLFLNSEVFTINIFYFNLGGTLEKYDKKLDAIENGSFPPSKEVADFEQAIELTGNYIN